MLTRSTKAIRQATSLKEQIEKLASGAKGPVAESLVTLGKKIDGELAGGRGSAARDTLTALNGEVYALYGELDSADAAPTVAQTAALRKIATDVTHALERWTALSTKDVTSLNQQLKTAGMVEIVVKEAKVDDDDNDDADVG